MINQPGSVYLDSVKSLFEHRLPSKWNSKDKFPTLCVGSDDRTLHYTGFGKSYRDAASIRADNEIPKECPIFYFEVKVLSQGRDGYLAVGLMSQNVNLQRLPGWEKDSYGYHGDDGNAFSASSTGKSYGPSYNTEDVVGCCLNQITSTLFFTKNGVNLGTAFTKIQPSLYPCMGLQSGEESIIANFGQEPFVFDIDSYFLNEQQRVSRQIVTRAWPVRDEVYGLAGCVENDGQMNQAQEIKNAKRQRFAMDFVMSGMMKRLALGYFEHHGLANTAKTFASEVSNSLETRFNENDEKNCLLITRKEIKRLITSGKMSEAAQKVQSAFPSVWKNKPDLFYKTCLQNFIESLRGVEEPWLDENISETIPKLSGHKDDQNCQMEVDDPPQVNTVKEQNGWSKSTDRTVQDLSLMQLAKKLYKMLVAIFDRDEIDKQESFLQNVICVIAYDKYSECPDYEEIFSENRRTKLSVEVNNAILDELGKMPLPALEQFVLHVEKLTDILNEKVDGYGGIIDLNEWL